MYLILLDYNITLGLDTLFIGYFCCSKLLIFGYVLFWLFFVLSCIAIWHIMNIYVTIYRKVTHFRRFVSFDNISHYFDRFIYQWLWYDLKKSELEMLSLKVVTGWKNVLFRDSIFFFALKEALIIYKIHWGSPILVSFSALLVIFLTLISYPLCNIHFIFSSPGPKVQVNYCHHLASVVCRLSSIVYRLNFSHFKLLLRNHWADWNQT